MMNKILRNVASMMSALLLWGCAESDYLGMPSPDTDSRYSILLTAGTMSRAGGNLAGENDAENKIGNYVIFFYQSEDGDPVYAVSGTANAVTQTSVQVKLTDDEVDRIFGAEHTVYAEALVNLPSDVTVNTSALTIDGKIATAENIAQTKVYHNFGTDAEPTSFVMHGSSSNITLNDDTRQLTGTISLKRVAAKVRLYVNLPDVVYVAANNRAYKDNEVEELLAEKMAGGTLTREQAVAEFENELIESGGQKCVPFPNNGENMRVFMQNGVRVARIDGETKEEDTRWMDSWEGPNNETPFFTALRTSQNARWQMKNVRPEPNADGSYEGWDWAVYERTHGTPIYSYPNDWTLTAEEEHQSYMLLALDWHIWSKSDDNSGEILYLQQPYYYQIPINTQSSNPHCLSSNFYYRVGLTVGMLGSINIGDPQEIDDVQWEVLPWNQEDVNMSLKEGKYLVFNETEYVMNNEQSIEIPFVTSHEVEVKNVYVTYFRFIDQWGTDAEGTGNNRRNEYSVRQTAYNGLTNHEGLIKDTNYGDVYAWPGYYEDSYYVGREHPKTVAEGAESRPTSLTDANDRTAWDLYESIYGMSDMYQCEIKNNVLIFNHPLVRWEERRTDNSSTMTRPAQYYVPVMNASNTGFKEAFSRYEITIIVGLKNDVAEGTTHLRQTIHLTQYPALYIEVSHNEGTTGNNGNQYVFVNNNRTTGNNWNNTTRLDALNGENNNPNMYVIHTTKLGENDKFIYQSGAILQYTIGDPRSLYYNNALSTANNTTALTFTANTNEGTGTNAWSSNSTRLGGGTGKIAYYYPTDESTGFGTKENFIAPIIRIASSFGKVNAISRTNARRRCASYQEAGRPAGRWRVPTKAEMQYIVNLSGEEIIPSLFTPSAIATANDYGYWTAQGGFVVVDRDNNNNFPGYAKGELYPYTGNNAVRCVYDEWFWVKTDGTQDLVNGGEKSTTFTWGDKPKDNPQE